MSDLYTEVLVEKKFTGKEMAIKVVLIFLTVLSAAMGLMITPLALIVTVVLGVLDYIFIPKLNVEYEYLYVNGELDIDRIFSKSKRKKAGRYDLAQMEIMAPSASHRLDTYRNNPGIKTVDFTSCNPEVPSYTFIIPSEKSLQRVLFEPNEIMLKDIRSKMPRKIFTD